ncbi:Glycogen phosphorylase (EC [Olavius sp. associated proteobacterium Delta 1]|nr:Glycogen phosphorylase (EC [Olavius sp. associated proteobacterium Delta 1]
MKNFQTYQVHPNIPENLAFLEMLSRNMWWCWKKDAIELFRRIDPPRWVESGRNPIAFLAKIPQNRFEQLAEDDGYLAHLDRVREAYQSLVLDPVSETMLPFQPGEITAYFSMEFGLHESLPLFAGGLGILAGDHLKAASNLALPLIGIGLMYHEGYFRQYLNQEGWQQEQYPQTDIYNLPVERVQDQAGNDLTITIQGPDGPIHAILWKITVGRIPLYLLDTNIAENPAASREITSRLYAGENKVRLAQEMLLGIGGMQALAAMEIKAKVLHMNEGHSAFASLQRLAQIMADYQVDLKTALEIIPRTTVFTTHTPVAAGHDEFAVDLVKPYLKPLEDQLNVSVDEILSWGQPVGSNADAPLSMFILALHMSAYCNGVSKLHGAVARRMWSHVWPQRPEEEVPISHVTNGIHVPTFISQELAYLFDRYLGPEWYLSSRKSENIGRIDEIYDEELWRGHEMNRSRLVRTCRKQLVDQYERRNAPRNVLEAVETALDQDTLTIAFARRFATYKRANLLLQDEKRLESIINNKKFPVQFIFAGKAHPKDNEGKELIKRLFQFASKPAVRDKIIFLENYDMHLARHLLQGADVWLNTPRRPYEACGTSGMKAAMNGLLNVSILDGWWCEGYSEESGWRIGNGEEYQDHSYQDAIESQALYNVLENEVIPCFYDRKNGDLPGCWVKKMKNSMKMAMESFCSLRMVSDYEKRYYNPAAERWDLLLANSAEEAKKLTAQLKRLRAHWKKIQIKPPVRQTQEPFRVGDSFQVTAEVNLAELSPDEVDVELYYGNLKTLDELATSHVEPMAVAEDTGSGNYIYGCTLRCNMSGRFGFTVRVSPRGDKRIKSTPRLLAWA